MIDSEHAQAPLFHTSKATVSPPENRVEYQGGQMSPGVATDLGYSALRRKEFLHTLNTSTVDWIYKSENSAVAQGDCLQVLRKIPNASVSLILTDPPYHSTKKDNIIGDRDFRDDNHYLEWMHYIITEWRRILKPNGSLLCFCSSAMSGALSQLLSDEFNLLNHIVWTKPNDPGFDGWKRKAKKQSLRQWYSHSERILFLEPATDGNLHRSPFGSWLKQMRKQAGLTSKELTELTGTYGRVNNGGAISNWEAGRNTPSRLQFERLSSALSDRLEGEPLPCYEDCIRPFTVSEDEAFDDVWTFKSVRPYSGKHPAEKPLDMLKFAIKATTFAEDLVLDCFAGSGSTAAAAKSVGRRSISIEIDSHWSKRAVERLTGSAFSLLDQAVAVHTDEEVNLFQCPR